MNANTAVLVVAGVIVGAGLLGGAGALFGAGLGALAGVSLALHRRVQALEHAARTVPAAARDASERDRGKDAAPTAAAAVVDARVDAPGRAAGDAPGAARAPDDAVGAPGDAAGAPGDAAVDSPVGAASSRDRPRRRPTAAAATPAQATAESGAAPSPGALGPSLVDRGTDVLKRWFTTGNVPVKVGLLLSLLGVAFLVREAADRDWLIVPLPLRLAGAAAFGIALIAIGWRLRAARRVYALSLQGGGLAIVYVTVYAAYALYGLVPPVAAFALLVTLTAAGVALAVLEDSRSLAVLAIAGGFLAPVLASTEAGSHVVLFGYYAVLNAGIFAIAWFRAWRELNVLGFLFTFGLATLWGVLEYEPAQLATTEPFLVAFVAMYLVIPLLFAERQEPRLAGFVDGTLVFGVPLAGFGLQTQLLAGRDLWLAASALVLAVTYVALATWLFRRRGTERRALVECYVSLCLVFVTIAIPLALDARWTSVAWSLQGAAMVWLGLRQSRPLALAAGVVLQGLAAAGYFRALLPAPSADIVVLNGMCLGALVIAAAGVFSSWVFDRVRAERPHALAAIAAVVMLGWGVVWWIGAALREVLLFVPGGNGPAVLLLVAAASTAGALGIAHAARWPRIAHVGALVVPGTAAVLLLTLEDPLHDLGWLGWPVAFAAHYGYLYRHSPHARFAQAWHVAGFWLLTAVAAYGARGLTADVLDGVWPATAGLAIVAGLLAVTASAGRRLGWPLAAEWRSYLAAGCGGVAAALGYAVVSLNLTSAGDAPPLPYVPLVNPLELASVLALGAIGYWYAALRNEIVIPEPARRLELLVPVLTAGLLLTMIVARTVHHWTGVPFEYAALVDSNVLQAALSIVWGSAGLAGMTVGARLARREIWLGGAVLMGIVVVKLFVVELGDTGTLTRIVSFLGVGVLLLVVGYFAPVPPRAAPSEARATPST